MSKNRSSSECNEQRDNNDQKNSSIGGRRRLVYDDHAFVTGPRLAVLQSVTARTADAVRNLGRSRCHRCALAVVVRRVRHRSLLIDRRLHRNQRLIFAVRNARTVTRKHDGTSARLECRSVARRAFEIDKRYSRAVAELRRCECVCAASPKPNDERMPKTITCAPKPNKDSTKLRMVLIIDTTRNFHLLLGAIAFRVSIETGQVGERTLRRLRATGNRFARVRRFVRNEARRSFHVC